MSAIIENIQAGVGHIVPMIVLLGLLIFVHEMGHFLVAKFNKVRVEIFSLGFGPKIFKFRRGDTVYAISAIPLGGYVKMFGDDPTADVAGDQRQFSFTHKPVGQRIAIVLAGPLMNFFFAILLFMAVAMIGEQTLSPKVGDVAPDSAAYAVGFRSGDTIVKVGEEPIESWEEFQKIVEGQGEQSVQVQAKREGTDETVTLTAAPKTVPNRNVLSWAKMVGEIQGLSYSSRASVVGVADPDSAAAQAGLRTGDFVTAVEGVKVERWREFVAEMGKRMQDASVKLTVQRQETEAPVAVSPETAAPEAKGDQGPAVQEITLNIPASAKGQEPEAALKAAGIEFPELFLAGVEKESPAMRAGLQKGDKLISINGQPTGDFDQVAKTIRSFDTTAQVPLKLTVMRAGKPMDMTVSPNLKERMNNQGKEEKRFEIGIKPMIYEANPATFEMKVANPVAALGRGFTQTIKWTNLTVLSFVRLFQAEVSAKNIGGFISIGQMAKRSWQIGPSQFLNVMAIISLNLYVINLLPVPVLDGGHLLFFGIEALRGAPVSMRKLEIAQQVGLILLLGLMVFALFNDVTRIFN